MNNVPWCSFCALLLVMFWSKENMALRQCTPYKRTKWRKVAAAAKGVVGRIHEVACTREVDQLDQVTFVIRTQLPHTVSVAGFHLLVIATDNGQVRDRPFPNLGTVKRVTSWCAPHELSQIIHICIKDGFLGTGHIPELRPSTKIFQSMVLSI